jgi:hypothetical protein
VQRCGGCCSTRQGVRSTHNLLTRINNSASVRIHLVLVTRQVGVTRDAATVDAIFDRISRVAVASRSLRCLGSCALNLCRCGFSTLCAWRHCSMLSCTGTGLLGKHPYSHVEHCCAPWLPAPQTRHACMLAAGAVTAAPMLQCGDGPAGCILRDRLWRSLGCCCSGAHSGGGRWSGCRSCWGIVQPAIKEGTGSKQSADRAIGAHHCRCQVQCS